MDDRCRGSLEAESCSEGQNGNSAACAGGRREGGGGQFAELTLRLGRDALRLQWKQRHGSVLQRQDHGTPPHGEARAAARALAPSRRNSLWNGGEQRWKNALC